MNNIIKRIKRRIIRCYLKHKGFLYKDTQAIYIEGLPSIHICGKCRVEGMLIMVSSLKHSVLGVNRPCKINVFEGGILHFRGNCGLSNSVIIATKNITIGKNVMIGAGCTIIDTDFHSDNYHDWFSPQDRKNMKSKDVTIGDNVFIGMNCTILKGVHIGDGAIIGAGSIVSKSIPGNEVWGGNPVVFIKKRKTYEDSASI